MDRDFTAEKPGEKLVSDLTYIATDEGFLFLVCVIDVCTRRVAGWSMSHEMTTSVFLSALLMAVRKFDPSTCLLHHSDRGSQYCSKTFQEELSRLKIQCSMSRKSHNAADGLSPAHIGLSLRRLHLCRACVHFARLRQDTKSTAAVVSPQPT